MHTYLLFLSAVPLVSGFVRVSLGAGRCRAILVPASTQTAPEIPAVETRVEDANVPEAHRGLHDFLYGANEDHGAAQQGRPSTALSFSKDQEFPVSDWLSRFEAQKVAGVYAVVDAGKAVRYVGVSRSVSTTLKAHVLQKGPLAVASVRIQSFKYPKRDEMLAYRDAWLAELQEVPEGNRGDDNGWAQSIKEAAAIEGLTEQQQQQYNDQKVKMRMAMADPTLGDELDQLDTTDDPDRAAKLRRAVEDDDWSAVIDEQTSRTRILQATESAAVSSAAPAIVSPFQQNAGSPKSSSSSAQRTNVDDDDEDDGDDEEHFLKLTPENVDKVLDEVRPYLISDGGNIEIVRIDVEQRDIYLRLQGACGSCPSSTTTMRMGVERVLKEKFASLGKVEAVNDMAALTAEGNSATRELVENKVNEILPAIRGLGGSVAVEDVSPAGVVTLSFRGPEKVKLGIVYAVKSLPGVTDVQTKA